MSAIQQLRAAIKGCVIGPTDPGYDVARTVFRGGVDRHPAAIRLNQHPAAIRLNQNIPPSE